MPLTLYEVCRQSQPVVLLALWVSIDINSDRRASASLAGEWALRRSFLLAATIGPNRDAGRLLAIPERSGR